VSLQAHGVNPSLGRLVGTITQCPTDDEQPCSRATDTEWATLNAGRTVTLTATSNGNYQLVHFDFPVLEGLFAQVVDNSRALIYLNYTNADSSVSVDDQVVVRARKSVCSF